MATFSGADVSVLGAHEAKSVMADAALKVRSLVI